MIHILERHTERRKSEILLMILKNMMVKKPASQEELWHGESMGN